MAPNIDGAVRTAVVGLGGIGRFHATTLARRRPSAELTLVIDAVGMLAEETGAALGSGWSVSYDDALGRPDVDAVVLATPTPFHARMIEEAAAAGKHVFCEKPIALRLAEADAAVAAAREAGVVLQLGFHRRFDPDWMAGREWLDRGALGEPRLLRISHRNRQPPHASDGLARLGDLFVDVTIHDLDATRWLLGEVDTVFALSGTTLHDHSGPDLGEAVLALRCASGCLVLIDNTRRACYGFECSAEIVGSTATARIGGQHRRRDVELLTPNGLELMRATDHLERHRPAYEAEMESFVRAVALGSPASVTGDDGVAALELAIAARVSTIEGGPVRIEDIRSRNDSLTSTGIGQRP